MNAINMTVAILALGICGTLQAEEFTVGQKDKQFTESKMTIKIGDKVSFKNEDPFSHNVYSLSDAKGFDLGSYPMGEARSVTFDKPGIIEVGCAVHMDMAMTIEVK